MWLALWMLGRPIGPRRSAHAGEPGPGGARGRVRRAGCARRAGGRLRGARARHRASARRRRWRCRWPKRVRELVLGHPGADRVAARMRRRGCGRWRTEDVEAMTGMSALARAIEHGRTGHPARCRRLPLVRLDDRPLPRGGAAAHGLDDFGDPGFREPLRRVIDDYEHEARLSFLGRIAARQDIDPAALEPAAHRVAPQAASRARPSSRSRRRSSSPACRAPAPRCCTGCWRRTRRHRAPLSWEMMFPVAAARSGRTIITTRASRRPSGSCAGSTA